MQIKPGATFALDTFGNVLVGAVMALPPEVEFANAAGQSGSLPMGRFVALVKRQLKDWEAQALASQWLTAKVASFRSHRD